MIGSLRELFSHVSRRRRQLGPVLMLMLAGAVAEVVSLGAILPFLAVVSKPQEALASERLRPLLDVLGLNTPMELVIAAAVGFALSAVIAAAVRLLLVWGSQKFVFAVAHELSVAVYRRTLHQPYAYHTAHNSSETLAAINKAQLVTNGLLVPLMQAASAAIIALFILLGLLFVDPLVALVSGFGFGVIYLLVMHFTKRMMRRNGGVIARAQKERVQAAGEGLGGIRDVLLDRSQMVFVKRFSAVESDLRRTQGTNNFVAAAPRFVVEGLGLVLIAGLALMLSLRDGGLVGAIPVLGALALGAQRLLPLLQQLYTGWTSYMANGQSLRDVLDILRLPDAPQFAASQNVEPLPFNTAIALENVRFSYPAVSRPAIEEVNLVISKGMRVGFVGKTGSGKSTLMDIVLGLLTPTGGRILIDGVELSDANRSAWQARIAHVPQAIYLSDGSIAENIAFGVSSEKIDHARVHRAAEQAELLDVIEALPQGYGSIVGERGIRLSGGQRQRIGIARALYKQADVLVFDEATSALDNETERAVMQAIDGLSRALTVILIAHRISTLAKCDYIFELNAGKVSLRVDDVLQQTNNRTG
ncbi:ABC transporter ATP-binding protein/permease [Mesorhizobium sp. M0833]|uniref:ABC transporter ATP-binding protein n=1 Tax=Mesorhizobium sp. M0833 TaxID=2957009 RepID=UPI00333AA0B7